MLNLRQFVKGNGEGLSLVENFELLSVLTAFVVNGQFSLELAKSGPDGKAQTLKASEIKVVSATNNRFGTSRSFNFS